MGGPCYAASGNAIQSTDNFMTCYPPIRDAHDRAWLSSEAFFHAAKFEATDPELVERIRTEGQIRAVCVLGNSSPESLRSDWEAVKVELMYTGGSRLKLRPQASRLPRDGC